MKITQLVLCVLFFYACNSAHTSDVESKAPDLGIKSVAEKTIVNHQKIADAKFIIQDGDLILRAGKDYSSEQVKLFSKKDQTYSHGGIAFHDSGNIYIYHVIPDYFHINDKVRKEKIDSFCNPAENSEFGIARYKLNASEINKFHKYLDEKYKKHTAFDMSFNLKSDDSLYCSEMIKKGLLFATNKRINIATDKLTDRNKFKMLSQYFRIPVKSFAGRQFIPIDNLFVNENCSVIKRYTFEQ